MTYGFVHRRPVARSLDGPRRRAEVHDGDRVDLGALLGEASHLAAGFEAGLAAVDAGHSRSRCSFGRRGR